MGRAVIVDRASVDPSQIVVHDAHAQRTLRRPLRFRVSRTDLPAQHPSESFEMSPALCMTNQSRRR